jgi:hypothetical protein
MLGIHGSVAIITLWPSVSTLAESGWLISAHVRSDEVGPLQHDVLAAVIAQPDGLAPGVLKVNPGAA